MQTVTAADTMLGFRVGQQSRLNRSRAPQRIAMVRRRRAVETQHRRRWLRVKRLNLSMVYCSARLLLVRICHLSGWGRSGAQARSRAGLARAAFCVLAPGVSD